MSANYKKTLEAAEAELAELMTDKARIDNRVVRLRETILALNRLLASDTEENEGVRLAEAGLTKSIREALQELRKTQPDRYHLPTTIRDRLREKGFPLSDYKNEMAAIHNVLKRLKDMGDVEIGTDGKKSYYRWKDEDNIPY